MTEKNTPDAEQGAEGTIPERTSRMVTNADLPVGYEAWPDIRSVRSGKSTRISTDEVAEVLAAIVQLRGGPRLMVVVDDRPRGPKVFVHPALCAAVENWYTDLLKSLEPYAPKVEQ